MMLRMAARGVAVRLGLAVALLAVASGLFLARKRMIAAFFVRGPGGGVRPALALPPEAGRARAGLGPVPLLRVALLDGVDRDTADMLPAYRAVCARGLSLTVDVGFPTVSLPVQSVLWTGLTQQQSGIEFVQARIDPPPAGSLPAREPSSAAVSETHAFIAQSFGFARAYPRLDTAKKDVAPWAERGFPIVAAELVASDTRLVFVHMLAADSAGHKMGRDSPEFGAAAANLDQLLGRLVDLDRGVHGDRSRWLVLADHGHRPAGGHGGEEPRVRLVRACFAGPGLERAAEMPSGHLVHMVDISRAIADSLGLAPHPDSAGRPLWGAIAAPEQPKITLPRPGPLRWAIAAALLSAAAFGTWLAARRRVWRLPWWWVLAYVSVVSIQTVPSLSTPMVYKPLGQDIYLAALPGLLLLAIGAGAAVRRTSPWRVVAAQLMVPAAITAAGVILCWRTPPLMPLWTAHTSVFLVILYTGSLVVALAILASLVPLQSGGAREPDSSI
jgi:hypothetical protein